MSESDPVSSPSDAAPETASNAAPDTSIDAAPGTAPAGQPYLLMHVAPGFVALFTMSVLMLFYVIGLLVTMMVSWGDMSNQLIELLIFGSLGVSVGGYLIGLIWAYLFNVTARRQGGLPVRLARVEFEPATAPVGEPPAKPLTPGQGTS
ncbi:MAG: hypothetical protein AAGC55_05150 [Myxococcota bacterium]